MIAEVTGAMKRGFVNLVDVGGRQFFLCWTTGVVGTLLLVTKFIGENTWSLIVLGVVGAYITGNQVQNYITAKVTNADEAALNARRPTDLGGE